MMRSAIAAGLFLCVSTQAFAAGPSNNRTGPLVGSVTPLLTGGMRVLNRIDVGLTSGPGVQRVLTRGIGPMIGPLSNLAAPLIYNVGAPVLSGLSRPVLVLTPGR